MYKIKQAKSFHRAVEKLIKQRRISLERINSIIIKLSQNPYDPSLRTHKVTTRTLGLRYSSRLDSDLRIIWSFDEEDSLMIHLLDLGGHSGNKAVY